jgi:hypothetical protein
MEKARNGRGVFYEHKKHLKIILKHWTDLFNKYVDLGEILQA